MLSVAINTLAVVLGSVIGLAVRRGLPERFRNAIVTGIGLCTVYIGITGALKGENAVVLIVSIVIGAAIGTAIDIDRRLVSLGSMLEKRFGSKRGKKTRGDAPSIAQGFVTASLMFCVGSMTVVGSINAGLLGDNTMIYTKSALDLVSSLMLAASLGIGVLFSAGFVLLFQGGIVLLARMLTPLVENPSMLAEMTCAGSLLIVALGLNLIGVTRIKVANYLPAIVIAPILALLITLF